ncbi:MAG: hypothetical protein ACLFV3_11310 [Phycisphaeraceae bacterium]
MIFKMTKYGLVAGAAALLLGGLMFGRDVVSYVYSGTRSVQTAVKDSVPVEFEIQRARDMAEQIIPELQANIRLIAEEEVEIATLRDDITDSEERLAEQRGRIARLRTMLDSGRAEFTLAGHNYSRERVGQDLADRFSHYREAKDILAGKRRLLETREQSLAAAMQTLERTRDRKTRLEQQIQSLQAQHRLVEAASVGSRVSVDDSQLARTQRLIDNIKKRLDVSERMLTHEARLVERVPVEEQVNEDELVAEVDAYFSPEPTRAPETAEQASPGESRELSRR